MIQRIQSAYLLVSILLTALFAFLSFANFQVNDSIYFMKVMGLYYQDTNEVLFEAPNMSLSTVVFFSILLSISALFNFKKRSVQIRLVTLAVVVTTEVIRLVVSLKNHVDVTVLCLKVWNGSVFQSVRTTMSNQAILLVQSPMKPVWMLNTLGT